MQAGNERLNRTNPFLRVMSSVMSVLLVVNLVPSEALAEIHLGPRSPSGVPEETPAEVVEETVVDHTTKQPPVDILSYLAYTEIEGATFNGVEYEVTENTPVVVKYAFEETAGNQFPDDYEYYFRLPDAFLPSNGQPYLDDSIVVSYHDGMQVNYITISSNQWYIANNEVHFSWNQSDGSGFSFMQAQDLASFELRIEGTFLPGYSAVDFGAGYVNLKFPDQYVEESDEGYEEEQQPQQQPTSTSTVFEFGSTSELVQEGVPVTEGDAQKKQKDTDPAASKKTDPNKPETAATDPAQQAATPDAADATDQTGTSAPEATDEQAEQKTTNPGTVSQFTYEDDQVLVVANVADPSVFPEGAELKAKPIPSYQGEFNNYIAALNNASDKTYDENNTILFDIAFFLNGEEIQPTNGTVDVTIKFKKYQLKNEIGAASLANVEVNHLPVVDGNVVVENVDAEVSVKNEVAQLNAESFSVYAFSYTVDFVYNGYTFNMPGNGNITLSELFTKLGINESISSVEDVEFSDSSLLRVEKDFRDLVGSEWVLVSLMPFDTPEQLTVRMDNGNVYVVDVTDESQTLEGNTQVIALISGREWNLATDNLEFTLKADPNNPYGAELPDNTDASITTENQPDINDQRHTSFDAIKFSAPGTFTFQVSEGFTRYIDDLASDRDVQYVTFVVVPDGNGGFTIDEDASQMTATFTNKKCVTLHMHKYLEDARGADVGDISWPTDGKANFTIDPYIKDKILYMNDVISAAQYETHTDDSSPYADAVFKLTYDESDHSHSYSYVINEQALTGTWPSGWKRDDRKVMAIVDVYEKPGESFGADVRYQKETQAGSNTYSDLDTEYGVFTNVYEPSPVSVSIRVQKNIAGRDWRKDGEVAYTEIVDGEEVKTPFAGDSFWFHLESLAEADAADEAITGGEPLQTDMKMSYDTIEIIDGDADDNGNHIETFSGITLNKEGFYKFKVTEEAPPSSVTDMKYDSNPRFVFFKVKDGGEGALVAEMVSENTDPVTFNNSFLGCTVPLKIAKLAEPKWPDYGKATFRITALNGAPEPLGDKEVPFEKDETKDFVTLAFTKAGKFEYEISEIADETHGFEEGWRVNPPRVRVIVNVSYRLRPKDGKATSLYVSSVEFRDQDGEEIPVDDNTVVFTNEEVGKGTLRISTKFKGIEPSSSLLKKIKIVVTDSEGKEREVPLKDDGSAIISDLTAGTYTIGDTIGTYSISEVGEELPGYDEVQKTYSLPSSGIITDGKITISKGMTTELTILNTYIASKSIRVKEVVENGVWPTSGKATVALAIPEGAPIPDDKDDKEVSKSGDYADFGEFHTVPRQAGEYTYTLTSTNNFGAGWVTTPSAITATLKVDAAGVPTITYDSSNDTFINTYVGTASLRLTKHISGIDVTKLTDEQKKAIKTTVVDSAGTEFEITLDEYKTDNSGDYYYELTDDVLTAGQCTITEEAELEGYELFINGKKVQGATVVGSPVIAQGSEFKQTLDETYAMPSDVTVTVKVDGAEWTSSEVSSVTLDLVTKNGDVISTSNITLSGDNYTATFEGVSLYPYNNTLSGSYTIKEENAPERVGYAVVVSEPQIEVKGDGVQIDATVTNSYVEKGKLEIIKEVSGTTLSDSDIRNISFNITSDNGYSNSIGLSDFDVVTSGTKFSHIEEGLDAGTYYLTEEVSTKKENYDLETTYSSSSESGSSVENTKKVTITVKNAYTVNVRGTGRLTVSNKVVSNTDSDKTKSFKYTVKLSGTTGSLVSGTYGDMTFKDGVATFSLAGGDSVSASELPTVGYTVTQDSVSGYNTTSSGASGTISSNSRASFTNTKTENNNSNNSSSSSSSSSNTNSNSNNSSSNNSNKNTNSNTTTGSNSKVTIKLTANKRLTGRTLVANEFSFALRDGNGNLLQTKTNTSSGSVTFDGIDLSAEGTYYYVISEVKGSAADITYDTHQARVTVTVTKDSGGTFTAKAAYDSSNSTTFNNTYTGTGSTATAANGSSSSASKASTAGTAATTTQANKDNLAKTADPTLFTALPMLVTAGAASVAAGVIRRRKRK